MLEGLATWILNNYLRKYVENLNTDQLSIALLSGEVELENLPLRKDSFYNLGIPIRIQSGFIGKIKLQIPLRQIRSAPWVIIIEQLYAVATPINLNEWDNELEECAQQEYKLSILDNLEAQWRAETESYPEAGYYASSLSSWMNYGTGLVTNIIENLQLKIKDVHIRYEDNITCSEENSFACGLLMESFSAESCDSEWHRSFNTFTSTSSGGCSFKLLELQKMSFYWDETRSNSEKFADLTLNEFATRMHEILTSNLGFVINPVTAVAQLKRERCEQPLRSRTRPRFTCQLSLDEVPILITDKQYNQMIGCAHGLSMIGRLREFKKWRPNVPVSKDVRAWWIYAIKCHFSDCTFMYPKPTWEKCLETAKQCIQYVNLYKMLLITPSVTLTADQKLFKDEMEWTRPFEQLKLLRESAMRNVPVKQNGVKKNGDGVNQERAQGRSVLMQWFPQWLGWYSSNLVQDSENPSIPNKTETTPDLEGEILDVIADSIENNTLLKRDTVFGQFKFMLNKGSLQLCSLIDPPDGNSKNKTMLELNFENLGFSIEARPRTSSHTINITLGAIYLRDHITEKSLFPILIAPQGIIRESLSNLKFSSTPQYTQKAISSKNSSSTLNVNEDLFQLTYECKPLGMNCDYRLFVKSQSLEIVYNVQAVRWLVDFFSSPFSSNSDMKMEKFVISNGAYAHVKNTTKMRLINQWENILQGDTNERSLWNLELDISAPQIILVERFTDKNSVVGVLDFGKMHLSNGMIETQPDPVTEDDDNEMFMTPCSTPPGSEASDMNLTDCGASPLPSDTPVPNSSVLLNQDALHHRLYDRYKVEFSDLQILIGRIKDNWKFSNVKGSSSLHVLDKFNILIQVERRVIYTSDPQFPSVTLCGTLPNLIVHLNEHKLLFIQSLITELNSPQFSGSNCVPSVSLGEEWKISPPVDGQLDEPSEIELTERSSNQLSKLLMLQFAIDQMALEVQSRGRSIAEIQVCGVRAALTKRPFDLNLSLSVHSLLLVDALQTYGPDFELLIASHKHVGMDSVSGSIRDSEPTSPTSPSSPPDGISILPLHPPPPAALSQALNSLNTQITHMRTCVSPIIESADIAAAAAGIIDSEALIVVDLTIVSGDCPSSQGEELRIANILFNNLDIIANQETIVELIGFAKRISTIPFPTRTVSEDSTFSENISNEELSIENVVENKIVRTEITFDFHRLNVLLLRASLEDGNIVGKKIGTATMSDAKIQATIGNKCVEMNGSLGGLQVVSLCPGSMLHQKIISVGHDPLANRNENLSNTLVTSLAQEVYSRAFSSNSLCQEEEKALSFHITKTFINSMENENDNIVEDVIVNIRMRMASVWYTHSGIFLGEVQSCASEFKQYLSNLARSIKAAATDMAIGLVNVRGESIYNNARSGSMEWISPRRPRSISIGPIDSEDLDTYSNVLLNIDILLETPVVVVPRSPTSTEVFVARLGNISITNKTGVNKHYSIQIKDINLYSLDIKTRHNSSISTTTVESMYRCGSRGKPILHDTTIHLSIEQIDDPKDDFSCEHPIQITGKVVTPLKVSATRHQYEQLLETVNGLGVHPPSQTASNHQSSFNADSTGVSALNLDPQLRAEIFKTYSPEKVSTSLQHIKVLFQLPIFTIELRGNVGKGEQSIVDLSFRDFFVKYEKYHLYETNVEVSLHSITMEDLLRDVNSKHRFMMLSHKQTVQKSAFVSNSVSDLRNSDESSVVNSNHVTYKNRRRSLPDKLSSIHAFENTSFPISSAARQTSKFLSLPEDNLVLIKIQFVDPHHPLFLEKYKNVRKSTKLDFNCLDLVVSVDSWVVFLDFFGMGADTNLSENKKTESSKTNVKPEANEIHGDIEMDITVQSLNIVLLRPQYEVCRANISRLKVLVEDSCSTSGNVGGRRISGTLGSMSLMDLSPHGKIWRERFLSSGKEALNFQYERYTPNDALIADCDTRLLIEMSTVIYVHTKRFVSEIQAFFREFSLLQNVLSQARQKVSVTANSHFTRMQMSIECLSPAILIPVSSKSSSLLVAELEKLSVSNEFKKSGSPGTISALRDSENDVREILDVMKVNLVNMDLYCGEKRKDDDFQYFSVRELLNNEKKRNKIFGPSAIVDRLGPFLLTEKCGLTLQVEKNLENYHNVADMSIQGTLNTLDGAIDLRQYKVIKGLLSNNLGENLDDLYTSEILPSQNTSSDEKIWTLTSIRFDLLNVTLRLELEHELHSLACINFIKSRLLVETFSDLTQDIDLVSQEILISDTRYKSDPVNKRCNVFSNIVLPMGLQIDENNQHSVQAEIHARKRKEHSAYTILVNNMRLMAIIDWWQAVNEFIMSPAVGNDKKIDNMTIEHQSDFDNISPSYKQISSNESQFELKVNITDSQVVFVEDTSQWDTNAVILKSTTVITYKPGSEPKPLSCVLNHCEVFSCVIGMEEETALSIIDPVTLQIDLSSNKILQMQVTQMSVRLSYHDVCMLVKMFQSLPQQTRSARAASNKHILPTNKNRENLQKLGNLGFTMKDCEIALSESCGNLDLAALWLTENSKAITQIQQNSLNDTQSFDCFQIKADCISICIIDDCRDSDVPLLELSLSEMNLLQDMRHSESQSSQSPSLCFSPASNEIDLITRETGPGGGRLQCRLTSDYYNRTLSGWEPFIEPWRCDASWEFGLTSNLKRNRLQFELNSTETLSINITSTLMELYSVVKLNWMQDYYSLSNRVEASPKSSPPGYRRRSPFVPFALRNYSGCKLWFTTIVTTADIFSENIELPDPDETWTEVLPDQTASFKFGERGKQRHRDSHKLQLHQLGVRIDGWNSISPVCVDKVGVFFRHITHTKSDIEARIIFSVTLEGSARKLVTIRSALQLANHLPETIEVRADNIVMKSPGNWSGSSISKSVFINSGDVWCVPLSHNPTPMWIRPIINYATSPSSNYISSYLYCAQPLDWRLAARQEPEESLQLPHVCHSNTQSSYRFCCILRREKFPLERGLPQPGHILILKPPITIINLLPIELNFKSDQCDQSTGRISAGQSAPLMQVDIQKNVEISIYLEGFPGVAILTVPPTSTDSFSVRLKLSDTSGRKLTLNAHVSIKSTDTIKISISAPFWIINRTGVPIVFRQEGVPTETAGQFEEHEIARMVAPLLFSFADSDGSPTVVARVGAGVIPNGIPQWCSPFGLSSGIMVRRLVVNNVSGIGSSERVLLVGITIRPGRGRYRHTNICTISPRFQIHNNTSFNLQFAQKCFATSITDPRAISTYINTVPECSMPFHWPRHDHDLLLCVRILDIPNCHWSGGFRIDMNHSLHINIRDNNAACYFLRLEVILQSATYFIVFTDADTMPPPIRLDNFSFVHLTFHQVGCKDESLIKAHSSKPWALVEPCGANTLALRAPGGTGTTINLHKLDETKSLTYQNFIYIAFTGTHQNKDSGIVNDVENSQLVLEVTSGPSSSGNVILARKRHGERAQLWRLNKQGHLLHEGSSPPQPAHAPPDVSAPHALVLDIEGPAPQPSTMVGLCVRRANPRRASTQTWHFTPDGRLCCAHKNMNVQPLDGFFGLREGNRAVLGLPGPSGPHVLPNGVPIEHAVSTQTLRPGSGFLNVTVITDGPTRVIKIVDIKQQDNKLWEGQSEESNTDSEINGRETQIRVAVGGIGVSLVSQSPSQELLFCLFSGMLLETIWTPNGQALNLSMQDIQFDNQLLGTPCPVLLHSTKTRAGSSQGGNLPAIHLSIERVATPPNTRYNAHIFKHFIISLRPLSIHLEERLLLKLFLWSGMNNADEIVGKEDPDETDFETQKILTEITAVHAKRYYFGVLKLVPNQIRLSMQTTGKLPPSLTMIKKKLGLTLIKFEDAGVELEPFIRWHPFETSQFLWHSILKHYKDELKWQAAIILGSVDFLGNPLGFVQDVSDGVSGLIYEGNVGALVKNVAHGLSNSAAKVSESLGDGIGRVIMDEAHEETRARIRGTGESGGTSHLVAGLRGLGLGLLGGVTSLVKHTYEGAAHQGVQGFLTGVGRGLIGTVTKPVVGVLDLAAETAAAVRDTSRRSDRWIPERSRPPRCPIGPGGLLPRYSRNQSIGHQYLYAINGRDYEEEFLAYDCIRGQSSDIRALISTRFLRIFTCSTGDPNIVIEVHLSNLICCQTVTNSPGEHYIELTVKVDGLSGSGVRRPQVLCDTPDLARWVSHQVNYAKCMFHEKLFTLQEADVD